MTDTPPSPADELRTAAEKLRKLTSAPGLHPGPWEVHNRGGYPEAIYSPAADLILGESYDLLDEPQPHATYIAAMHPGVATALANWLDSEARSCDAAVTAAGRVFTDDAAERQRFIASRENPHALAVSRAVLGTTDRSGR